MRVLIIHHEGNFANNPTIKCIIDLLLDRGVKLTLRHERNIAPVPTYECVSVQSWSRLHGKIKRFICDRLGSRVLLNIILGIEYLGHRESYDLIIGVDRGGLIDSCYLSSHWQVPYVFLSFELTFREETSAVFKRLEKESANSLSMWIIQDKVRRFHAMTEYGLDLNNCILLPLASEGEGKASDERLRDILGVPHEKKVAILMGSLTDWSMSHEIIMSVETWPNEWVLIVHDRYGNTRASLERLGLASILNDRIYLSSQSVQDVDDMSVMFSGINAGIAFYRPNYLGPYTGRNLGYLGLASGKIATYLRYGVPVIMNKIGLYSDLANEHGFGVVVSDQDDIGGVLGVDSLGSMGNNARRFYNEYLDFKNYKNVLWERLSDCATKKA